MNDKPIQPPQHEEVISKKSFQPTHMVLLGIIGVFLLGLGLLGGYILGQNKNQPLANTNSDMQTVPTTTQEELPTSVPTTTDTVNWKTYSFPTLGLTFKLPPKISSLGELKEEVAAGETGTLLCGQFVTGTSNTQQGCYTKTNPYMYLGTTSVDYSQGRGGTFTDLQGFVYKDGKYLARFVNGQSVDAFPQKNITKVTNPNEVEIIKIKGNEVPDEGPTFMNSLGNTTGVLINTKKVTYTGLAIVFENEVSEKEIDQILSSFQFIK